MTWVVSQSDIASEVGWQVMKSGGNAIDGAGTGPRGNTGCNLFE